MVRASKDLLPFFLSAPLLALAYPTAVVYWLFSSPFILRILNDIVSHTTT